jgi:hypothetical protein
MPKRYPNNPHRYRGDVAQALNRLVATGRIGSFRTNLTSGVPPEHLEVHVVPIPGQESGVEEEVLRALGTLVDSVGSVAVRVPMAEAQHQGHYRLVKLAPGSFDVLAGDTVVASLARDGREGSWWSVELLDDLPREKRPAPFLELRHRFKTLREARAWLGEPPMVRRGD